MTSRLKSMLFLWVLLQLSCSRLDPDSTVIPGPVPKSVTPKAKPNCTPVSVVIKGEHFIVKVTRQLSDKDAFHINDQFFAELRAEGNTPVELDQIIYVDSETIRATVPADIAVEDRKSVV